jgi:hypothetical protein
MQGRVPKESWLLSWTQSGNGLGHKAAGPGRCWALDQPVTRSGDLLVVHGSSQAPSAVRPASTWSS